MASAADCVEPAQPVQECHLVILTCTVGHSIYGKCNWHLFILLFCVFKYNFYAFILNVGSLFNLPTFTGFLCHATDRQIDKQADRQTLDGAKVPRWTIGSSVRKIHHEVEKQSLSVK